MYRADSSGSGQGRSRSSVQRCLPVQPETARPVQSGTEYLSVCATGIGPVLGANGEPAPADGATAPSRRCTGLTPTLVELYEVNIQGPAGVPTGSSVPLVLTVTDPVTGSAYQSNTVSIAVQ
ncbi:MAG TPA: hypothetical protein VK789_26345 [Bryobacteraceae bacterium]|nr:hypothetical protein [Bryobacteraceae bacterium]